MALIITVVVSLCANIPAGDINKRVAELEKQYPQAKVKVSVDKKCLKSSL